MTERLKKVAELLGALLGCAAYVALLGGTREWARAAAAGLSPRRVLSAEDSRTLLTSGLSGLAVIPATVVVMLIVIRVIRDVSAASQPAPVLTVLARSWQWLLGSSCVMVSLLLAGEVVLPGLIVIDMQFDSKLSTVVLFVMLGVLIAAISYVLLRLARDQADNIASWPAPLDELPQPVQKMLTWAADHQTAAPRVILGLVGLGAVSGALLAFVRSTLLVFAPFVFMCLGLAAALLTYGGARWLRANASETTTDTEHFSINAVVVASFVAAFLPMYLGVLSVGFVALVLLTPTTATSLGLRSALVGTWLAAGLIASDNRAPQQHDPHRLRPRQRRRSVDR